MERGKHSYQNQIVQVSKKIFTSFNAADESLICAIITWLFLRISPNILCTEYSGICKVQANKMCRIERPNKMAVQTSSLNQLPGGILQGVITLTEYLDAILSKVLENEIAVLKNITSELNMLGDRRVK